MSSTRTLITPTSFLVSLVFVYKVHTTLDNKPRIANSPSFLYRYSQYASSDTLTTSLVSEISVSRKKRTLPYKRRETRETSRSAAFNERNFFRPRDKLYISRSRKFSLTPNFVYDLCAPDWSIITVFIDRFGLFCALFGENWRFATATWIYCYFYYFGAHLVRPNFAFRFSNY